MQEAMTEWDDKIDTDKKKSFAEFRKYCIKVNLAKIGDKQMLKSIGIANSVEDVDNERIGELEQGVDKLLQGLSTLNNKVNAVASAVQSIESKPKASNDQNDWITKLLANNNQCLVAPSSKVAELEKKLADVTNKLNNNNNGNNNNGNNNNEVPDGYVLVKWIHYCSSCGVNTTHDNDNCTRKQSWHKAGATYENQMGGNTQNMRMWGKTIKRKIGRRNRNRN